MKKKVPVICLAPITDQKKGEAPTTPLTMALYIMGVADLFIALEIAAIVFIYTIGKRKKSNQESQIEDVISEII